LEKQQHILLINGIDRKGIIFLVAQTLFAQKCNIISQEEYVSPDGYFFMRTAFESEQNIDLQQLTMALTAELGANLTIRINPRRKKNIVLFATKEHHCLADLLTRHYFDELNANIQAVISNHQNLAEYCAKFSIPYHYISHQNIDKTTHESQILKLLELYQPEYLVLAKYMRILSTQFTAQFHNRIINIHHSFLPAFVGARPYQQAFDRGVKIIGATSHFVNENLDEGPIITQNVREVNHSHSAAKMANMGREIEKTVLSKALDLVFADRVFIHNNKTIIL
jgi:formyltetrahydrofolate deformylase